MGTTAASPFQNMTSKDFEIPLPKKRRYHAGILRDGPAWCYHLAGIEFPRFTIRFGQANGSNGEREEYREDGTILELTDEQVKAAFEQAKHRFVRWRSDKNGARITAQIFADDNRMFSPQPGDESILKYVYCRLLPDEVGESQAATFDVPTADSSVKLPPGAIAAADSVAAEQSAMKAATESEAAARENPRDAALRAMNSALKKLPAGAPRPETPVVKG